ncbi:hypothetical protein FKP32DRAFT_1641437 [Trametes sanguinea]|nr:hypothetical protein FKP32DRAFT_1641437 [Trametes sanguinea]
MSPGKPRRRRTLLTMKKKAYRRFQERTEEDIAFSRMVPARAFDVEVMIVDPTIHGGYTYRRVVFNKGDDVVLNSPCDDTEDVWIGRISQIRCSHDRKEVLVKVCWYWSRNDVAKEVKSFRTSQCAPYERVLSDHYDYVSPYAFQDVVYVHEYDERSLDPPLLGPRDLFVRTQFMHRKKAFKPPLGAETCICQVAYNPFPSSTPSPSSDDVDSDDIYASSKDVMHFCPSLKCRKWYHTSCLLASNNCDPLPGQTRGLRLLAVAPDEEALFATFEYFYEQESTEGMAYANAVSLQEALIMLDRSPEIVAHLPSSLLTIAQMPIVRCAGTSHGLAIGNVADVVLARRFVYAAVQNSGDPACTNTFLQLLARTEAVYPAPTMFWASLQAAISPYLLESDDEFVARIAQVGEEVEELGLLATPYAPYWERRERTYRELQGMFSGPSLICPQCRGCI